MRGCTWKVRESTSHTHTHITCAQPCAASDVDGSGRQADHVDNYTDDWRLFMRGTLVSYHTCLKWDTTLQTALADSGKQKRRWTLEKLFFFFFLIARAPFTHNLNKCTTFLEHCTLLVSRCKQHLHLGSHQKCCLNEVLLDGAGSRHWHGGPTSTHRPHRSLQSARLSEVWNRILLGAALHGKV